MAGNYHRMSLAVFLVFVALSAGSGVLAETHHVVGGDAGWGPHLDVGSWSSGRVFRVGDKIWFSLSAAGESIAELQSLDDFLSCNLTNPIRMYTDGTSQVTLEKEGARYFTSGDVENCKNGLKLHVPIEPPPFGPFEPIEPPPVTPEPFKPEPFDPPPSYEPPEPYPPVFVPPPPPTPRPRPSASTNLNGLSFVFLAGLSLCFLGL